jgi:DNA-directed RNA polymerase subunit RPC12/RpoP
MTDALKPTATLTWNLYVDCPQCGKSNDLASGDHDTDHDIAKHIFTNAWDKLDGWEVECEHCGHEFQIERVEY